MDDQPVSGANPAFDNANGSSSFISIGVYIAAGISGARRHVVVDLFQVLPALTEEVKKAKAH